MLHQIRTAAAFAFYAIAGIYVFASFNAVVEAVGRLSV